MVTFTSNSLTFNMRDHVKSRLKFNETLKGEFGFFNWDYNAIEISLKSRENFHLRFHEYQDQLDQLKQLEPNIEDELIVILAKEVYFGYLKEQFRNFSVQKFLETLILLIIYDDIIYKQKFFIAGETNAYLIINNFLFHDDRLTLNYNKKKNEFEVAVKNLGEKTIKKKGISTIKPITDLNGIKELKKKHKDSGSNIKIEKGRDGLFKAFFADKMTHKNKAYEPTMAFIEELSHFMFENLRRNTMQFDIDFNITSTEEFCKTLLFFSNEIEEKSKQAAISMIGKLIKNFEIEYLPGKFKHYKNNNEINSEIFQNLLKIMQTNTDVVLSLDDKIIFRRKKSQFNLSVPDFKLFVLETISSLKIGNKNIASHKLLEHFSIDPVDKFSIIPIDNFNEQIKDLYTNIKDYKNLIDYSKNELEINRPDTISSEIFIKELSEVIIKSSIDLDDVIIEEYKKNVVKIWLNKFQLELKTDHNFIDCLEKDMVNLRFESEIKGLPIDISNEIISIATMDFTIKIKDDHFIVFNLNNLEEQDLEEKLFYELDKSGIYKTDPFQFVNLKKCFKIEFDGNNLLLTPLPFKKCFDILYRPRSDNKFRDYMRSGNIDSHSEPLISFFKDMQNNEKILDPFVIANNWWIEQTEGGKNRTVKGYNMSNNLIKSFSITTINIGEGELYFESEYIRPYFSIDQFEDKLFIKYLSSFDYVHQLLVSVVNVYNKKLNLFAKTRPKKIVQDFQGGRFAVSESIKNSIKKAKKTPREVYKKRLEEEAAYIFVAFDRSGSMTKGSRINYRYLLALLGYGFHHRFKSLVYGLICSSGENIGNVDLTALKKTNANYMRTADSINYEIAYSHTALSAKYDEILKNIKEIQNALTDPAIPNKFQLKIKLRLLTEELYRTKYNMPSPESMITAISQEDEIYTSARSIRIKYGNLTDEELIKKGIEPTYRIEKEKTRKFWEFNNIKDYLKVIARENLGGGTDFSGAYDLVEHPLLMKGKGLKYFFILTDADVNEASGERAMKPMSGRYSNIGGLIGVTYNLERVASRSDTRFAYFYYSKIGFPNAIAGKDFVKMNEKSQKMRIKKEALIYKTKDEAHILNWTKETANALFYMQTDNSDVREYLWELKIIGEMVELGLMKPYESKYFEEKCLQTPLKKLIDLQAPKLPIYEEWKDYYEKKKIEDNIGDYSTRSKNVMAKYLHMDFIRRYWQSIFMLNFDNNASNSLVYLIFKRLSKLKFFVTDPI